MKAIDTEKCRDDIDDAHILEGHMCAFAGINTGGCHVRILQKKINCGKNVILIGKIIFRVTREAPWYGIVS